VQGEENLWLVGEEGYVWLIYTDATLYWWVLAAKCTVAWCTALNTMLCVIACDGLLASSS
jgi:hypothetical protein